MGGAQNASPTDPEWAETLSRFDKDRNDLITEALEPGTVYRAAKNGQNETYKTPTYQISPQTTPEIREA